MTNGKGSRGFTLLELSIVLVLIGIIIGGGLAVLTSSLQASQFNATVARMDAIETALLNYGIAKTRLPCPADLTLSVSSVNYGMEAGAGSGSLIAAGTGVCTGTGMLPVANFVGSSGTVEGGLPTRALSLPDEYMYDGWGRKFRYAVDPTVTLSGTLPPAANPYGCSAASASPITINDSTGAARSAVAVYAVISHGANGHGAYTSNGVVMNVSSNSVDELTNCHCTNTGAAATYAPTYVQKVPAYDTGQNGNSNYYYDDIVSYKESWQIQSAVSPLAAASKCVYVTDYMNNRVEKFDNGGGYVSQLGCVSGSCSSSSSNGGFTSPAGLATDTKGNVYVADYGNGRVQEFNSGGLWQNSISTNLTTPTSLAIDASGNLWVLNDGTGQVMKYDSNGNYLLTLGSGSPSSGNGQFSGPKSITTDLAGNLWVADFGNNRMEEFSNAGVWQISRGGGTASPCWTAPSGTVPACPSGAANGQFNGPTAVTVDANNNLWIADTGNARFQEFTNNAYFTSYANKFAGVAGSANGKFSFNARSWNMGFDPSGNLWIPDYGNNRIQKFSSIGGWMLSRGGATNSCWTSPNGGVPGCAAGTASGQFNGAASVAIR